MFSTASTKPPRAHVHVHSCQTEALIMNISEGSQLVGSLAARTRAGGRLLPFSPSVA